MGLKCFDGFDHYKSETDMNARQGFLAYSILGNPPFAGLVSPGRFGVGKAYHVEFHWTATFGQRVAETFIGIACLPVYDNVPSGEFHIQLNDTVGDDGQITVQFSWINNSVTLYRGGAPTDGGDGVVIATSASNVWAGGGYFYVEIHSLIATSGGTVEVRVNEQTVLTFSGNTQKTANAWIDQINVRATNSEVTLDDFYYCDTSADPGLFANNTFLGDVRVATLFEVGNDSVQWSPSPNTNANYQNVDETAMDSDATYNFSSNPGNKDRFNFQALPNIAAAIFGVAVTSAGRKDDAGTRQFKNVVKSGATESLGALQTLPDTSYAYFSDQWILNPDTGLNWTPTDVDAIQAGYQLIA